MSPFPMTGTLLCVWTCLQWRASLTTQHDPLYYTDYSISYTCPLDVLTQVHQHLLDNVERPISKDVDKMEFTLLTLDVENLLRSSAI